MSEYRVKIAVFEAGWVTFTQNFTQRGHLPPTISAQMDSQWMLYNFAADRFHTNKLCSTLSSSEIDFLDGNDKIVIFEAT